MPTKLFDDLVDFFNAYIDKPVRHFGRYIFDRFGSAKVMQVHYYIHATFTLTLYILFMGYPLAVLRRLSLEPEYVPLYQINRIGALLTFSTIILPLLIIASYRLRMQYKAEYTTRKIEDE